MQQRKVFKPNDLRCNQPLQPLLPPEDLKENINSVLEVLDEGIKEILGDDHTPGGAVVSFVYRDQVIWSAGYGLKDMKSMSDY